MKIKHCLVILLLISITGCKTKEIKYIPLREVHTEEIIMRDTLVDIRLVPYFETVNIADTVSYLENEYAYSEAIYTTAGLKHSLGIKDVEFLHEIQYIERIIRDSIHVPIEVKGDTLVQTKRDYIWWLGLVCQLFCLGYLIGRIVKRMK